MPQRVTTLWYLAADPAQQPVRGAASDPGYARRLLSRLYPKTTATSLGAFPLNRSASAGPGEIYIGSYPGATVVQTGEPEAERPSRLSDRWKHLDTSSILLSFTFDSESGVSGFARWEDGRLVRAFAGSTYRIAEDEGIPQPFERPFWAGEYPQDDTENENSLALPFDPAVMARHAQREWLGFDLRPDGVDLGVHGFATDGRREVRQHSGTPGAHVSPGTSRAEQFDTPDADSFYDDYEPVRGRHTVDERSMLADAATHTRSAFTALKRRVSGVARRLGRS